MKIGIVVPKLSGGGAEYVAREWAEYLADAGVDVTVLVTEPCGPIHDCPFTVVEVAGKSFLSRARSLRELIGNLHLDVVIGLMPYWNLLVLAASKPTKRFKTKVVISSHTIESGYGARRGRGFMAQTLLARLVYRFAGALVASSHPVAAEALARYGIRRDRLWVVPNPVFPDCVETPPERLRGADGANTLSLVVPGRMVFQKRPGLAVDVALLLGRQWGNNPEVIFVGEGSATEAIRRRASEAGVKADFRDWNPRWASTVPNDSVVLLPSMLEGFGNVLVDATAAGLPLVVSSRALGVADAVIPGITGELVSGDTAADYARGVLAVSKTRSREYVNIDPWLNRFTRENSGEQLLIVIDSLVKRGHESS